jgi:hypothetical protein
MLSTGVVRVSLLRKIGVGTQAGLLAGAVVATTFFLADVGRLEPLTTPMALSGRFLGATAKMLDDRILADSFAIASFGAHLAAITLVHFLAFAVLGVIAVLICHAWQIPLNAVTGALFGLVAFSLVFYVATWFTNAASPVNLPGPGTVLMVNVLAGAVMGGYCQLASRRAAGVGPSSL